MIKKFEEFKGFTYSHIIPKDVEPEILNKSKNISFILYGASNSGKTKIAKMLFEKE